LLVQRLIFTPDHTQSHTYAEKNDSIPKDEVSSLIPLPDNTQHSQEGLTYAPGEIRTPTPTCKRRTS